VSLFALILKEPTALRLHLPTQLLEVVLSQVFLAKDTVAMT
jgi:hypothetical protein